MGRATELRVTALFLLAAAAIAWVVTADRMQGMDAGPGTDLGAFGWFAGIWAVMMAAMMLPSLVPMAGAYAGQARGGSPDVTPQSLLRTTLFTSRVPDRLGSRRTRGLGLGPRVSARSISPFSAGMTPAGTSPGP